MKTALVLALLIATISAINIECDFEMSLIAFSHSELYSCWVKKITFTGSTSLEAVAGIHKAGKSDADVKQLNFGWEKAICDNMTFIPQNIHKHFPNIIGTLFWGSCNISTLTGDELKDYRNLELFLLSNNPLERVPGTLFQHNPKMKHVGLWNNTIAQVGQDIFDNLQDLTYVYFDGNVCISEYAENNRTGVLHIIEDLRQKCPDSATTTTQEDPSGSQEQRIYKLEHQVVDLKAEIQALRQELQSQKKELMDELMSLKDTVLDGFKMLKSQQV